MQRIERAVVAALKKAEWTRSRSERCTARAVVARSASLGIDGPWPNARRILSICSLSASRRCSRIASLPPYRAELPATALLLVAVADVV